MYKKILVPREVSVAGIPSEDGVYNFPSFISKDTEHFHLTILISNLVINGGTHDIENNPGLNL